MYCVKLLWCVVGMVFQCLKVILLLLPLDCQRNCRAKGKVNFFTDTGRVPRAILLKITPKNAMLGNENP